jgi:hypothetical protein
VDPNAPGTQPGAAWCWPMYLSLPIAPLAVNSAVWPICMGRMYVLSVVGSDGLAELEIMEACKADAGHSVEPHKHVVKRPKTLHVEASSWVCTHDSGGSPGTERFWAGFNLLYWCQPESKHFYIVDSALIIDS